MKKVGILTIHNSYNYGAVLQAYATLKTFQNLGAEAELVDYSTNISRESKKFLLFPSNKRRIKHDIRNLCHPKRFLERKHIFEKFFRENMQISHKSYSSKNYESIANENYDYIVTGSDQTFNLNLNKNENWHDREVYFLPFDFEGKKVSYSASMGEKISTYTDEQKEFMLNCFRDYDFLSVREEVAADFIENLTESRPKVIYDPTLAVSREEWDKLCTKPLHNKKYILFYTVLSEPWVIEYVKNISKATGLEVVAAHPQNSLEIGCNFSRASNSGPGEFISLIKNAEYVITTSFHGTVFSAIYKKPFYSLILGEGNRIGNLLSKASLEKRIIRKGEEKELDFDVSDFGNIDSFLKEAEETNINFIKSALNI